MILLNKKYSETYDSQPNLIICFSLRKFFHWKMVRRRLTQELYVAIAIVIGSSTDAFVPTTITNLNKQGPSITSRHVKKAPPQLCYNRIQSKTKLNGICEWRDTIFDIPGTGTFNDAGLMNEEGIPREITVLPFPYEDVLLQGETKQLRLYEDRFIQLFDECMEKHSGVVAMGLIADSGIIQTVPICEVEAYNRMEGFGIFVTIRVVGRGALLELTKQEPYIKAVCIETMDNIPPNLDIPNMIAGNIENFIVSISSLEHKLKMMYEGKQSNGIEDVKDEDMKRRIVEAKLDDQFYKDEDDDDDDDDDDDFDEQPDRNAQFKKAFAQAKACDTQGYMISSNTSECERSAQDLTALSWAAFCADEVSETIRVQALDSDDLFDRLKMASYMLREEKAELEAKLALTEAKLKDDDDDE